MKNIAAILIFLSILSTGAANADNPVRLKSVGVQGGLLMPQTNWENGFSIGLQADVGEIMKYVFLRPHIGFWQAKMNQEEQELVLTDFHFGARFTGYFNSRPRGFYAGLGFQYHIIGQDVVSEGFDTVKDAVQKQQLNRVGYSIFAGYLLMTGKILLTLEPGYTVLPGTDNMLTISLGVGYLLP